MYTDLLDVSRAMLERLELNNGGHALDPVQQRGWAERFRGALDPLAPINSHEPEDCPSCEAGEDPWLEKCPNCDGTGKVLPTLDWLTFLVADAHHRGWEDPALTRLGWKPGTPIPDHLKARTSWAPTE